MKFLTGNKMRYFNIWLVMLLFVYAIRGLSAEEDLFARQEYTCYRIKDGTMHLDGKLDEDFWFEVPEIEIREMATGEALPFSSKAKIVWDSKCLYVGYILKDTNVYSKAEKGLDYRSRTKPRALCGLPHPFVKLFLDPDADGADYMEVHIDARGNITDLLQVIPYCNQHSKIVKPQVSRILWGWDCEGIRAAVYVDGTIDNPEDVDKGWSVELAVPWSSLDKITAGKCPPLSGDRWLVSVQRVVHTDTRIYGSWPTLGIVDSHIIDRWGYLVFSDKKPERLQLKLVWVETMPQKTEKQIEDAVIKAKSLGFNAIAWETNKWEAFIYACRVHNIKHYGIIQMTGLRESDYLEKIKYQVEQAIAKGFTGLVFNDTESEKADNKAMAEFYETMSKYAVSYAKSVMNRTVEIICSGIVPLVKLSGKDDIQTVERVKKELQVIKKSESRTIQIYELGLILSSPKISKIITDELGGNQKIMFSTQKRITGPLYDKKLTNPDD